MDITNNANTWLRKQFLVQKLNNPIGFILLLGIGLTIAYFVAMQGISIGVVIIGVSLSLPIVLVCFMYPYFGLYTMLSIGFIVPYLMKLTDTPVGTMLDSLIFLMSFGIFVRQINDRDWSFAKNPISIAVLFWIYFNVLEVLNPWAESQMAWIYTVRTVAVMLIFYFIVCYSLDSLEKVKGIIKGVIIWALISALWGLKQEYRGFTNQEMTWLMSDPERFELMFQWGRFRIFSLMSDATTFGVLVTFVGMYCFIMSTGPNKTLYKRIIYIIMGALMWFAMAYSGTRTAYALAPLGFVFWSLLKMNRNVLIITAVFLLFGTALVLKGSSNPVIFRIQSAFRPSEDQSMLVRIKNQKFIQPFIQSHPIGAGLGSTGLWGRRFTPDSMLANFPHDSGFVRIAVETGYVGLFLYMILLFTIMRQAIFYYIRVRNPEIKNMYLGLCVIVFILTVGSYPQEIIPQLPISIVFYILVACIVRLKDFDDELPISTLPKQNNHFS